MSNEKKFTAREAAMAVLKKTEEMLKSSALAKAVTRDEHEKGVHNVALVYNSSTKNVEHGQSDAGLAAKKSSSGRGTPEVSGAKAKKLHSEKLNELKAMPKPNLPKSEGEPAPIEGDPDQKQDATLGEKVEALVEQHMKENGAAEQQEGHDMGNMKGHMKLAKFMGRMDYKRGSKKSN